MAGAFETIFTQRCPRCGRGKLFKGFFVMEERCSECGAVFMRDPGAWTGATAMAYVAGSVFFFVGLAWIWMTGHIDSMVATQSLALGTVVFVFFALRFAKAFWVGLLYGMGYVYPDDDEPPASGDDAPTAQPGDDASHDTPAGDDAPKG